jgi:hypothetical protein
MALAYIVFEPGLDGIKSFKNLWRLREKYFSKTQDVKLSELMNAMLQHIKNLAINRVTAAEVSYVMNRLKAVGVSIPWFNLMTNFFS